MCEKWVVLDPPVVGRYEWSSRCHTSSFQQGFQYCLVSCKKVWSARIYQQRDWKVENCTLRRVSSSSSVQCDLQDSHSDSANQHSWKLFLLLSFAVIKRWLFEKSQILSKAIGNIKTAQNADPPKKINQLFQKSVFSDAKTQTHQAVLSIQVRAECAKCHKSIANIYCSNTSMHARKIW